MSQADDILKAAANVDAATRAAELETDLVEHEGEATLFTFEDDSVLVVLDDKLSVFADIAAARKALAL